MKMIKYLTLLVCITILSGCGMYVTPTYITVAERSCEANGGLKYIDTVTSANEDDTYIVCNNEMKTTMKKALDQYKAK